MKRNCGPTTHSARSFAGFLRCETLRCVLRAARNGPASSKIRRSLDED
jgi:hypothetical protein